MPKAFILVGAPAVGKKAMISRVSEMIGSLAVVQSYTDRPALPGEIEGRDYFFCSREEFSDLVSREEFLEWVTLPDGRYGTVKSLYYEHLECGNIPITTMHPEQYVRIMRDLTEDFVSIFVTPDSADALVSRQLAAGYTPDSVPVQYGWETQYLSHFHHVIVNSSPSLAAERLFGIICKYIDESHYVMNLSVDQDDLVQLEYIVEEGELVCNL